jgi:phosphoglycolate phosphatase
MPYRLAIFDFDGTLADSFPWFTRVVNDTADKFRFRRVAPEEIDGLRGKSSREMMQILGVSAWKLPFIARYIRKRKAQDLHGIPLFAEAPSALKRLHATGVTLAIVSSNSEANIRKMFGPDTARLIAHYECGSSLHGKAKRFRAVLRKSGIAAQDTISIGDELRDIEAARKAGITFGAVTWGYTHGAAMKAARPDFAFDTFDAMVETIVALAR